MEDSKCWLLTNSASNSLQEIIFDTLGYKAPVLRKCIDIEIFQHLQSTETQINSIQSHCGTDLWRLLNLEHLVVLLVGPISHTSIKYMDYIEMF